MSILKLRKKNSIFNRLIGGLKKEYLGYKNKQFSTFSNIDKNTKTTSEAFINLVGKGGFWLS